MTNTMRRELAAKLVGLGTPFSYSLRIELASLSTHEIFKWFLASILFGARISEQLAARIYREFEKSSVTTPEKIVERGWDGLVQILDAGGYARYDFKTATKLLQIANSLIQTYNADLNRLYGESKSSSEPERRVKELAKGIGPVTLNIFLREMRPYWEKADPEPSELELLAAINLGIVSRPSSARAEIREFWSQHSSSIQDYVRLETGLVRIGKDYCRKESHTICPVLDYCPRSGRVSETFYF